MNAPPRNSIMVIKPYWDHGTWVFDDPAAGLTREPFVAGVPEMINTLVKHIPNARKGFRLTFSANPFPGYQKKFDWLREESGGNVYRMENPDMEGWLCPALFCYFDKAPKHLYARADAIEE
jgi:hypothetical protein